MTIVRKEYDSHYVRLKAFSDQGIVTAVVSVFGNVDLQGDRVMPGAFTTSLDRWRKSGDRIPVVWSHEWQDPMSHIGYVTDAQELSDGLLVTTQFDITGNPRAAYIFKLLKEQRVTNWSFAYDIVSERTAADGAHELLAVDLIEVGPALRGANPETFTVSAKTTTASAPFNVNWHSTALDHEAADMKRRERKAAHQGGTVIFDASDLGDLPEGYENLPGHLRWHVEERGLLYAVAEEENGTVVFEVPDIEVARVRMRSLYEEAIAANGKSRDPNSPAAWNAKIDEAASTKRVITNEDRRAADKFILAEKLAAVQRFLEQDEQRRLEQQVATLALNPVPVRVDARMRPDR